MTEEDLRKFDKEVLVQVVYELGMFEPGNTMARLRQCEKRLRYKKLSNRYEKLIEEWRQQIIAEDFVKCRAISKSVEQTERQMKRILGV